MRSFSNIMPNFAGKLHLLVDSIEGAIDGKTLSFSGKDLAVSIIMANFAAKEI